MHLVGFVIRICVCVYLCVCVLVSFSYVIITFVAEVALHSVSTSVIRKVSTVRVYLSRILEIVT